MTTHIFNTFGEGEEIFRGRIARARQATEEMMAIGQRMNDPRPTGFAMQNQAWIALMNNDYIAALNFAETAMDVAIAPYDVESARSAKIAALVLARRPEAFQMAQSFRDQCLANGWNWHLTGVEGFFGIALVLQGQISAQGLLR